MPIIANQAPSSASLEPVTLTPYSVAGSPLTVDEYAIDIAVIVPAGTMAQIQTAAGVSFQTGANITLNCNNRPLSNAFIISRASGTGTITALVARVTGRPATNA